MYYVSIIYCTAIVPIFVCKVNANVMYARSMPRWGGRKAVLSVVVVGISHHKIFPPPVVLTVLFFSLSNVIDARTLILGSLTAGNGILGKTIAPLNKVLHEPPTNHLGESMEFIENAFEPKHEVLKDLKKKIEDKGLSFHPYLAMSAINKEVERQAVELVEKTFKGMSIEALGKCNAEIKAYAEAEEARWSAFQEAKDKKPEEVLEGKKKKSK